MQITAKENLSLVICSKIYKSRFSAFPWWYGSKSVSLHQKKHWLLSGINERRDLYTDDNMKYGRIMILLMALGLSACLAAKEEDFVCEAVPGTELCLIRCLHCDMHGAVHKGELMVNRKIADKVMNIMKELYKAKYPIEKMRLVTEYDNDDEKSMTDNNTSAYNCRNIGGTKILSKHALGLAIDINPLYNPYVKKKSDGTLDVRPSAGKKYQKRHSVKDRLPYEIVKGDLCYRLFTEAGFTWGGNWRTLKDYQHFEYVR